MTHKKEHLAFARDGNAIVTLLGFVPQPNLQTAIIQAIAPCVAVREAKEISSPSRRRANE